MTSMKSGESTLPVWGGVNSEPVTRFVMLLSLPWIALGLDVRRGRLGGTPAVS